MKKIIKVLFLMLLSINLYAKDIKFSNSTDCIKQANIYYINFLKDKNISSIKKARDILKEGLKEYKENNLLSNALYEVESSYILNKYDDSVASDLKKSYKKILNVNPTIAIPPSFIEMLKDPNKNPIKFLKEAIKENKMYISSYIKLAEIYTDKKHYNLALATVKRAQKISNSPYLLNLKVNIEFFKLYDNDANNESCSLDNIDSWKKLLEDTKSLIKIAPKNSFSYMVLSLSYLNLGQKNMALYNAKKATEFDNDKLYLRNYYHIQIATSHAKEALSSKSIDDENKALAYLSMQKWNEAKDSYQKIIDDTNSTYFYDYLKKSLTIGMIDGAKKQIEYLANLPKKVKINNWNHKIINFLSNKISQKEYLLNIKNSCTKTEAYFYIAYKYLRDNNKDKAKKYFQKVLNLKIYDFIEYILSSYYIKKL